MSNKDVMFNQDLTIAFWVNVLDFRCCVFGFVAAVSDLLLCAGHCTNHQGKEQLLDRVMWKQWWWWWWWSRLTMSAPCKMYAMMASSIRSPLFSIPLARSVTEPPLHSWRKQTQIREKWSGTHYAFFINTSLSLAKMFIQLFIHGARFKYHK